MEIVRFTGFTNIHYFSSMPILCKDILEISFPIPPTTSTYQKTNVVKRSQIPKLVGGRVLLSTAFEPLQILQRCSWCQCPPFSLPPQPKSYLQLQKSYKSLLNLTLLKLHLHKYLTSCSFIMNILEKQTFHIFPSCVLFPILSFCFLCVTKQQILVQVFCVLQ